MLREQQLSEVLLSDGTVVHDLVHLDRRTVSARVLTDPEIYELELKKVFTRTWIFVAHESEIPNPGDFVNRYIGADPVIVARDAEGQIHVLLNSCTHRGAQVCRADFGNASTFRCPYHGWVFDNTGKLREVTLEREGFQDRLDKAALSLKKARVNIFHGLIFATWDHQAPSLIEYLGDIRWYLDIVWGLTDRGMEVVGPPQRWIIKCNWKLPSENFVADGYHVGGTHRALGEVGLLPMQTIDDILFGVNVTDPKTGHGLRCVSFFLPPGTEASLENVAPFFGLSPELLPQVERRLSKGQLEVFLSYPPVVGTIFPNFSWLNAPFPTEIGGPIEPMISIRLWRPHGPNETEVWSWALVQKGTSQEFKDAGRRCVIRTFGSSGIFEQDDAEVWSAIQRAVGGVVGRQMELTWYASIPATNDWPGPAVAYRGFAAEDNQLNWYRRWYQQMTS